MTKKQFDGLVDCLANVCTFNTSNSYSLSLREFHLSEHNYGKILVFTMDSRAVFNSIDIEHLLSLANAWDVSLYFETVNGVTVAKYI